LGRYPDLVELVAYFGPVRCDAVRLEHGPKNADPRTAWAGDVSRHVLDLDRGRTRQALLECLQDCALACEQGFPCIDGLERHGAQCAEPCLVVAENEVARLLAVAGWGIEIGYVPDGVARGAWGRRPSANGLKVLRGRCVAG